MPSALREPAVALPPDEGFPRRRHYLGLALAVTLAVVVGSLAPWDYRPLDLEDALQRFRLLSLSSLEIETYRDGGRLALPFLALGYCWLAVWTLDRKSWIARLAAAAGVALGGILLAMALGFAQFWFPPRTVSLNDLAAEALGCWAGVILWLIAGQLLTNGLRRLTRWAGERADWLRVIEQQHAAIQRAQQAARKESERQQAALEEATARLNALHEMLEREQVTISAAQEGMETHSRQRVEELAAQEALLGRRRDALDQQQRELETQAAQVHSDRRQLEAERAEFERQRAAVIAAQQEAYDQLERSRAGLLELRTELEERSRALDRQRAALADRLQEHEQERAQLQAVLEEHKAYEAEWRHSVSELENLRRELCRQLAATEVSGRSPPPQAPGRFPADVAANGEAEDERDPRSLARELDLCYDEVVTRLSETLQRKSWWHHLRSRFGPPGHAGDP